MLATPLNAVPVMVNRVGWAISSLVSRHGAVGPVSSVAATRMAWPGWSLS
jgi:hypothetical protein